MQRKEKAPSSTKWRISQGGAEEDAWGAGDCTAGGAGGGRGGAGGSGSVASSSCPCALLQLSSSRFTQAHVSYQAKWNRINYMVSLRFVIIINLLL